MKDVVDFIFLFCSHRNTRVRKRREKDVKEGGSGGFRRGPERDQGLGRRALRIKGLRVKG